MTPPHPTPAPTRLTDEQKAKLRETAQRYRLFDIIALLDELAAATAELKEHIKETGEYIQAAKVACAPHGHSGQPLPDMIRDLRLFLGDESIIERCHCDYMVRRWDYNTGKCQTCGNWCTVMAAANARRTKLAAAAGAGEKPEGTK